MSEQEPVIQPDPEPAAVPSDPPQKKVPNAAKSQRSRANFKRQKEKRIVRAEETKVRRGLPKAKKVGVSDPDSRPGRYEPGPGVTPAWKEVSKGLRAAWLERNEEKVHQILDKLADALIDGYMRFPAVRMEDGQIVPARCITVDTPMEWIGFARVMLDKMVPNAPESIEVNNNGLGALQFIQNNLTVRDRSNSFLERMEEQLVSLDERAGPQKTLPTGLSSREAGWNGHGRLAVGPGERDGDPEAPRPEPDVAGGDPAPV